MSTKYYRSRIDTNTSRESELQRFEQQLLKEQQEEKDLANELSRLAPATDAKTLSTIQQLSQQIAVLNDSIAKTIRDQEKTNALLSATNIGGKSRGSKSSYIRTGGRTTIKWDSSLNYKAGDEVRYNKEIWTAQHDILSNSKAPSLPDWKVMSEKDKLLLLGTGACKRFHLTRSVL